MPALPLGPGFRARVYAVVERIPTGVVLGYGQVAAALGSPRAARQVGYALAALEPGTLVPWWRVIRSDGSIALQGDPLRGPEQVRRLRAEGIEVSGDHRVDMALYRWDGDPTDAP
jgi:methylated-DNA-protein-cysteine methyltransferase related protein